VIRALLIDLDGVIRLWPADHGAEIERDHGLPAGTIAAAAFAAEILEPALTGAISDETWRDRIAKKIAGEHGPAAAAAVEAWSSLRGVVDQEMLNLVREVRRVMTVVLVTNQTSRLAVDLQALGVTDAFDAVANSADVGFTKPRREMYDAACKLAGVSPTECVLVDDRAGNVDRARDLGMIAIQHVNAAGSRRALIACGVPVARESDLT
jgi:putative hydrolase of the HAD superfamily